MDTVNIFDKIEIKLIFITIIQLRKGKWWLETILMFLDWEGSNFSILSIVMLDFLSIWPPSLSWYTQVKDLDPPLYSIYASITEG